MEHDLIPAAASAPQGSIRPMNVEDLDEVIRIERCCHSQPWSEELFRRELANPLSRIDLFWMGESIAGFICSWIICGEMEILDVATAPDWRRRGVAAALLRHALDRAEAEGCHSVFLEVRAGNSGAVELYCKFGFAVVSRRARYYSDGEDALVMRRQGSVGLTSSRERE